ncbi:MAG: hypothetical protein Tsb0021_04900 [Chlamydiales bacterium]
MSKLVKGFSDYLKKKLLDIGFKRNKEDIYLFPINKDVSGWIGINQGTQFGVISLNPVIGLTHQTIQEIYFRLCEYKAEKKLFPILCEPLRYLSNKFYSPKDVETVEDYPIEAERIIQCIKLFVFPFYEKNANLKSMLELMVEKHYGIPEQIIRSIPVAYHLLGESEKGVQFVKNELEKMKQKNSPYSGRI